MSTSGAYRCTRCPATFDRLSLHECPNDPAVRIRMLEARVEKLEKESATRPTREDINMIISNQIMTNFKASRKRT